MGDLFMDYEKDYGILTAEITAKINKIPNIHGEEKRALINETEQKFDEVQELLEQMDLEVRQMVGQHKSKSGSKLKSYKDEASKLEKDFKKSRVAFSDQEHARAQLLAGDDGMQTEDQRSNLLDATERVERSGRRLDEGYRLCVETEAIGEDILTNLERDRETMTRTRDRLRDTNTNLTKSSRILTAMMRRIVQNRIILALICLAILSVIGVVIYYATKTKS